MGLDMYLFGKKHPRVNKRDKDGFRVLSTMVELGYWRKHPNLHGYIVQNFAERDDCQEIPLDAEALRRILAASDADELPETTGFFFGASMPEDKEETREILLKAIAWLEGTKNSTTDRWRDVYYQASW